MARSRTGPVGTSAQLNRPLVLLAAVLTVVLLVFTWSVTEIDYFVSSLTMTGSTAAVGAVICWRRPHERVGWLLILVGVLFGIASVTEPWSATAVDPSMQPLPNSVFAAWLNEWVWLPLLALAFVVLPMVLPDGRPTSPVFGRLLRVVVAIVGAWTLCAMLEARLRDEPPGTLTGIVNPVGLLRLNDVEGPTTAPLLVATYLCSMALAIVSLVVRYRRSAGTARAQLRWIAVGAIATVSGFIMVGVVTLLLPSVSNWLYAIVVPMMPLSVGVAVLRHNLYDIDRLISRTISYTVVTTLLAGTYLFLVIALQEILPVRGHLPVAASTLVVALLFRPVRGRVQAIVDRRFNRGRYDAARTIEAFAHRLRSHVDLGIMTSDLKAVTAATVQPTTVHLWLRKPGQYESKLVDVRRRRHI